MSGDDAVTAEEIEAMHAEDRDFRYPAPRPLPVRGLFYLVECEHCGWIGSSEQCGDGGGPDHDDIVCPVCCDSILGDGPDEAGTREHGEAVMARILAAEAALAESERKRVEAERDLRACRERVIQVMDRRDAMRGVIRTLEAANKQQAEMLEAMRDRLCSVADFASTPTQETTHVEG